MTVKKIAEVEPYFFEGQLIISLSNQWIKVFGCIPKFDVTLNKQNRLVIESQEIIQSPQNSKDGVDLTP